MKKKWLLSLLFVYPWMLLAQGVDFDSIEEIALDYYYAGKYDSAHTIIDRGLVLSKKANNPYAEANFLIDKGLALQGQTLLPEALDAYSSAKAIAGKNADTLALASALFNTGTVYKQMGLHDKALPYLLDAADIFGTERDVEGIDQYASCLNTIANVYNELGRYKQALDYYKYSLSLQQGIGNQREIARVLSNIGDLFTKHGQYRLASIYLHKALAVKQALHDSAGMANTFDILSDLYKRQNDEAKAWSYLQQAYAIRLRSRNAIGLIASYHHLSKIYIEQGKYRDAENMLQKARPLCLQRNLQKDLLDNYYLSKKLYRLTRQPELALHFDDRFIALNDSLMSKEKQRSSDELSVKYATAQKDQELLFLSRQNIDKSDRIYLMSAFLAALFIISLVTFWAYYNKQRDKKRIELLMRELNHRVKNNFQVLYGMMRLQADQLEDARAQQAISEMMTRVHAMSLIHRKLYLGKEHTMISVHGFVREISRELVASYGFTAQTLQLSLELDALHLPADKAIPFGLIVNELLCNAFKYAFTGRPQPALSVRLACSRDKHIVLTVHDNGPGIDPDAATQHSFGFSLIRMLCRQLHAGLDITNQQGAHIVIRMQA